MAGAPTFRHPSRKNFTTGTSGARGNFVGPKLLPQLSASPSRQCQLCQSLPANLKVRRRRSHTGNKLHVIHTWLQARDATRCDAKLCDTPRHDATRCEAMRCDACGVMRCDDSAAHSHTPGQRGLYMAMHSHGWALSPVSGAGSASTPLFFPLRRGCRAR